jgi:3-oxoacyl-[acyl-carrier protein] reductase
MSQPEIVVITGAGRGIGKAIAKEISGQSIPVLCISRSEKANQTAEEINAAGFKAESLVLDIGDIDKTDTAMKEWISGKPYKNIGVVLAASVLGSKFEVDKFDAKEWDEVLRVNVVGNFTVLGALLPRMIENKFGRIVAFSGGGSAYAYPMFSAYSASKTAVVRTVENFAKELEGKGDFAIAALAPGAVETDMLKMVKEAGAEVKTTVNINEPVYFVKEFIQAKSCNFSGCFVHVRDVWKDYLNNENKLKDRDFWTLRRIDK